MIKRSRNNDDDRAYLPLRFWGTDDGDLPLSLLLGWLILLKGSDLHARAGEPDYVTDVRALGTDDGADAVIGNVEESCFLGIAGGDALLSRQAALVGIRGGSRTVEAGSTGAVAHTGGGHHGHRVQAGEHHALGLARTMMISIRSLVALRKGASNAIDALYLRQINDIQIFLD